MGIKQKVMKHLEQVNDPELNISIIDLGLVYKIDIDKQNNARIKMTLTTIGCPLFGLIEKEVQEKLKSLGLKRVDIELTFDPPWSMEKMSERGKAMLGI